MCEVIKVYTLRNLLLLLLLLLQRSCCNSFLYLDVQSYQMGSVQFLHIHI